MGKNRTRNRSSPPVLPIGSATQRRSPIPEQVASCGPIIPLAAIIVSALFVLIGTFMSVNQSDDPRPTPTLGITPVVAKSPTSTSSLGINPPPPTATPLPLAQKTHTIAVGSSTPIQTTPVATFTPYPTYSPFPSDTPLPQVAERTGNFTYPKQMGAGKPAPVIFTLIAPAVIFDAPPAAMAQPTATFEFEKAESLDAYVSVELQVSGGKITNASGEETQLLSDHSNTWTWDVTPEQDGNTVVLIPVLRVEYRDKDTGQTIIGPTTKWSNNYFVTDVIGPTIWDYLRENALGLITSILPSLVGTGGLVAIIVALIGRREKLQQPQTQSTP